MKTPNYMDCQDDVQTHEAEAKRMEAIGEFWTAQSHYLRCSGLSATQDDKRRFETLAFEMRDKGVASMILENRRQVADFIETDPPAPSFAKLKCHPRDAKVGDLMVVWYSNRHNLSRDERLINGTFYNAASRIHERRVDAARQAYAELIDKLPEGQERPEFPNTGSYEDLTVADVLAWLKQDPPDLIL